MGTYYYRINFQYDTFNAQQMANDSFQLIVSLPGYVLQLFEILTPMFTSWRMA